MSEKPNIHPDGWFKYVTPDGRVFLPQGDSGKFIMARIEVDDFGLAVKYERTEAGGFVPSE